MIKISISLSRYLGACSLFILLFACRTEKKEQPMFEVLDAGRTGLDFANRLKPDATLNMLNYMYFYNGAGVAAGDLNNDGLIDLFFCSNQGQNTLYLNEGDLKFKDVTILADIPADGGWSTGASLVDINHDGMLDIYICRVGQYEKLHYRNQLLICQGINPDGIPVYKDRAFAWGVDFSGFSTQAAFFDYDLDGDLDMYLLNHSLRYNSTFAARDNYRNTYDSLSGDRFYRNEGNFFRDITRQTGINGSIIGYGLGIVVNDFNLDGYPDLYIGNDFHENDYLYINRRDGTFRDELTQRIMHTSQFSMGVDAADINNDGQPEIISMDMLPEDPYILRRSLGEDEYNLFNMKIGFGYNYQYARNNLQFNRGNGYFSEAGLYAGVHATDWSWAPLWADFDNDGLKDLFISNGIPRRLNDIDYVNYISNANIQQKIRDKTMSEKEMTLIEQFPQIKLRNKFFSNQGSLRFSDIGGRIAGDRPTFSNGAVYADFDNDGDLDIAVNNIDEPALLYRNNCSDDSSRISLTIRAKGSKSNPLAIGSTAIVFAGGEKLVYQKQPVRGFQSSMEIPLQIGLTGVKADSIVWIWPDGRYSRIDWKPGIRALMIDYREDQPKFDFDRLKPVYLPGLHELENITGETGLKWLHLENRFNEFDREPLIPQLLSTEGPALARGDLNRDGLEDIFVGSSRGQKSAIWLQQAGGRLVQVRMPSLEADSTYEDTDACFADLNGDGFEDLVVASGGNEFYGQSEFLAPRIYLNNGKGLLTKKTDAFRSVLLTASCVAAHDFNNDGFTDLFIGARTVPFAYGQTPNSYLLQNDGTGRFSDATEKWSPQLRQAGFVKNAAWHDMDGDGDKDLLIALEWDGIAQFTAEKNQFTRQWVTVRKGWWNFAHPLDVDGDGDLDIIAGNQGLNSRLKASEKEPVTMYYADFDGNNTREQVLTYYVQGREIPFAVKSDLEKQMPALKKKFLYAEAFAEANLEEIFTRDKLDKAVIRKADFFANALLINEGKKGYRLTEMPWQAQLSALKTVTEVDANGDRLPDLWLAGNFYGNNVQMGRNEADYGTLLVNKGNGNFSFESYRGPLIRGEVRKIMPLTQNHTRTCLVARNNDSLLVMRWK